MNSTDITQRDIELWKHRIVEGQEALRENDTDKIKRALRRTILDMCFLVAFVESQLKVEVEQNVYDKAYQFQHDVRQYGEQEEYK